MSAQTSSQESVSVAWKYHRQGNSQRAEQIVRQLCRSQPGNPEVHFLAGVICLDQRRSDEAVTHFRKAIDLRNDFPEAHNNLGNALTSLGQWPQAVASYRQALKYRGDYPEGYNNLGNALRLCGELQEARECFEKALSFHPNYPEGLNNLGLVHRALGSQQQAMDCFRQSLRHRPNYPEASNNLGIVYASLSNYPEAVACFEMAIAQKPDYTDAMANLGLALLENEQPTKAVAVFERVLAKNPKSATSHLQLGKCLLKAGRLEDASASLRQSLRLDPQRPDVQYCLGEVFLQYGDYQEALTCFNRAASMANGYADAHVGRGLALTGLGDFAGALQAHEQAIALNPSAARSHACRANLLLSLGRLDEGWEELAWGSETDEALRRGLRPWQGEPLVGKKILLIASDSVSKTVLLLRYASMLSDRGAEVAVQCPNEILALASLCPAVSECVLADQPIAADYVSTLSRLPKTFKTTVDSIPTPTSSLNATPQLPAAWRQLLESVQGFKVGVYRRQEPQGFNGRTPLIPLSHLRILGEIPGVSIINLRSTDDDAVSTPAADDYHVLPAPSEEATELATLPAALADLSLLITNDAAVANVAGAVGVPSWFMASPASDWPWSSEGARDDSWYPQSKIYRYDSLHGWEPAVRQIYAELARQVRGADDRASEPTVDSIAGMLEQAGLEYSRNGDHKQALNCYRQSLILSPQSAAAHCSLAQELRRQGKKEAAMEHFDMAIRINPSYAEAHSSLGVLLASEGKYEAAIERFNEALKLKPEYAHALSNLGVAQLDIGKDDAAISTFERAVEMDPSFAKAQNNLGNAWRRKGQFEKSKIFYEKALEIDPAYADARLNLAIAVRELGDVSAAIEHCRKVIETRPRFADAYNQLGVSLARIEQHEAAIDAFRNALRISPEHPDFHNNIGIALGKVHRVSDAIASYREAIRIRADYAEAHNNLGIALTEIEDHETAIGHLETAIRLRPTYPAAYSNLGIALAEKGDAEIALLNYKKAVELAPEYAEGHMNLALCLLQQGRMKEGWDEYEWRWKCKDSRMPPFTQPVWNGEDLADRKIVLHSEQGLGDTLQFIRYAQLVKSRGAHVTAMCPGRLLPILARTPGVDEFVPIDGEPALPDCDYHAPLLNLPRVFETTLENVPDQTPYVFADPALMSHWRRRLHYYRGLKVGVNWQGNPRYRGDRHRSIPLVHFTSLADIPDVTYISLQQNFGSEQLDDISRVLPIESLGDGLDEKTGPFMDTAAVMMNLDLVITSDTALAHLAGSLGVTVWLAIPRACDWRWLREGSDCPWYPNVRIYRQGQIGNWGEVFERIARDLKVFQSKKSFRPIYVETAVGELVDKTTILEIKSDVIADPEKLRNVTHELHELRFILERDCVQSPELSSLKDQLLAVNRRLWDIEDEIRICERDGEFGPRFVELARLVYHVNDERAAIKREINRLCMSSVVEEKHYVDYAKDRAASISTPSLMQ